MVAGIVLASFARVASRAKFVHGKGKSFVRLDAQSAERHGSRHEVPHNAFHWLYLFDGNWRCSFLESEEVTDEDRLLFLIHHRRPFLELLVRAKSCCNLQVSNCIGVPSM